jgi:hypothetical protein
MQVALITANQSPMGHFSLSDLTGHTDLHPLCRTSLNARPPAFVSLVFLRLCRPFSSPAIVDDSNFKTFNRARHSELLAFAARPVYRLIEMF